MHDFPTAAAAAVGGSLLLSNVGEDFKMTTSEGEDPSAAVSPW